MKALINTEYNKAAAPTIAIGIISLVLEVLAQNDIRVDTNVTMIMVWLLTSLLVYLVPNKQGGTWTPDTGNDYRINTRDDEYRRRHPDEKGNE